MSWWTLDAIDQLQYLIHGRIYGQHERMYQQACAFYISSSQKTPTQKSKSIFSAPIMAEQHCIEKFESESLRQRIAHSGAKSDKKETAPSQNLN